MTEREEMIVSEITREFYDKYGHDPLAWMKWDGGLIALGKEGKDGFCEWVERNVKGFGWMGEMVCYTPTEMALLASGNCTKDDPDLNALGKIMEGL